MSRPCECDKSGCRLCWLFHNDSRYAERWGEEPSLTRKAIGIAMALVTHTAGGMQKASPEEQARRLSLCESCAHKVKGKNKCRICGCGLALKASWAEQRCPIGKW